MYDSYHVLKKTGNYINNSTIKLCAHKILQSLTSLIVFSDYSLVLLQCKKYICYVKNNLITKIKRRSIWEPRH
jgi:hypothetical protein